MNVERQYPHNFYIPSTPSPANCPWRSTPTTAHRLTVSFDNERRRNHYRTHVNYSYRKRKWRRPQLSSIVPIPIEIDVGRQLDKMSTGSVNALLREFAVAGVALFRLLQKQQIAVDVDIERVSAAYEERLRRRSREVQLLCVDLSYAAHFSSSRVAAVVSTLLRVSDGEIELIARRLGLPILYYLTDAGRIPLNLIDVCDRLV